MYVSIVNKVIEYVNKNGMFDNGNKVYVATSGGADSMALLAFLNSNKQAFGISEVAAAHVNHGIRGETANRDAKFVEAYCKKNNIEYKLFDANEDRVSVPENASEEWARQLRYGYLDTLVKDTSGVCIATAHTLSDQTETVLFRLARGGCGLKGLTGIPAKRGKYVRPFLCLTRYEIEYLVGYFETSNITDETNLGDEYSRNKIRHNVIPELKKINPDVEYSVGKAVERLDKAAKFISSYANNQLSENRYNGKSGIVYLSAFEDQDDIIVEEMIMQLISSNGGSNPKEQHIELLRDKIKESIAKNNEDEYNQVEHLVYAVEISNRQVVTITNFFVSINDKEEEKIEKNIGIGVNTFGCFGFGVIVTKLSYEQFKNECKDKRGLAWYAGCNKIQLDKCMIRGKNTGDKFKPACKVGGKLTKFIREYPVGCRNSVPIIVNKENNKVIWTHSLGFTDGYTPDDKSDFVYKFERVK